MKKNEEVLLTVDSMANTGAGVARSDSMVVFVPGALPGETVRARIIKVNKNYCIGRLEQIITPSPNRREPACKYFGRCGGCVMQHLEYNAQLESKKKETEQVLRRISGLPFEVSDIMGMYDPYHYRNKAILPIGRDESGNIVIGFYASRSHRIIDMDSCAIQSMDIKPFVQAVKRLAESTGTTVYDEVKHCGSLRQLMLRRSIIKGDIMAVLVVNEELKQPEMWAKGLLEAGACSVWKDINTEKGNIVLSPKCEFMAGKRDFEDDIAGVHFNLSPLSFLQVNHLQAAVLYGIATIYGGRWDDSVLVDAYCGTGILTQIMARFCGRAVGVEIVPDAVEDARRNALKNGVKNVEFIQGDCAKELPALIKRLGNIKVIILDPPRAGCDGAILEALTENPIERVIYISCDPATLARDAAVLARGGYSLGQTKCVDMFPQTAHIETICYFDYKKERDGAD